MVQNYIRGAQRVARLFKMKVFLVILWAVDYKVFAKPTESTNETVASSTVKPHNNVGKNGITIPEKIPIILPIDNVDSVPDITKLEVEKPPRERDFDKDILNTALHGIKFRKFRRDAEKHDGGRNRQLGLHLEIQSGERGEPLDGDCGQETEKKIFKDLTRIGALQVHYPFDPESTKLPQMYHVPWIRKTLAKAPEEHSKSNLPCLKKTIKELSMILENDNGKDEIVNEKLNDIILAFTKYLQHRKVKAANKVLNDNNESPVTEEANDRKINNKVIINRILSDLEALLQQKTNSNLKLNTILDVIRRNLDTVITSSKNQLCMESNLEQLTKDTNKAYQIYLSEIQCPTEHNTVQQNNHKLGNTLTEANEDKKPSESNSRRMQILNFKPLLVLVQPLNAIPYFDDLQNLYDTQEKTKTDNNECAKKASDNFSRLIEAIVLKLIQNVDCQQGSPVRTLMYEGEIPPIYLEIENEHPALNPTDLKQFIHSTLSDDNKRSWEEVMQFFENTHDNLEVDAFNFTLRDSGLNIPVYKISSKADNPYVKKVIIIPGIIKGSKKISRSDEKRISKGRLGGILEVFKSNNVKQIMERIRDLNLNVHEKVLYVPIVEKILKAIYVEVPEHIQRVIDALKPPVESLSKSKTSHVEKLAKTLQGKIKAGKVVNLFNLMASKSKNKAMNIYKNPKTYRRLRSLLNLLQDRSSIINSDIEYDSSTENNEKYHENDQSIDHDLPVAAPSSEFLRDEYLKKSKSIVNYLLKKLQEKVKEGKLVNLLKNMANKSKNEDKKLNPNIQHSTSSINLAQDESTTSDDDYDSDEENDEDDDDDNVNMDVKVDVDRYLPQETYSGEFLKLALQDKPASIDTNDKSTVELTYIFNQPRVRSNEPKFLVKYDLPYAQYLKHIGTIYESNALSKNSQINLVKVVNKQNNDRTVFYETNITEGPVVFYNNISILLDSLNFNKSDSFNGSNSLKHQTENETAISLKKVNGLEPLAENNDTLNTVVGKAIQENLVNNKSKEIVKNNINASLTTAKINEQSENTTPKDLKFELNTNDTKMTPQNTAVNKSDTEKGTLNLTNDRIQSDDLITLEKDNSNKKSPRQAVYIDTNGKILWNNYPIKSSDHERMARNLIIAPEKLKHLRYFKKKNYYGHRQEPSKLLEFLRRLHQRSKNSRF